MLRYTHFLFLLVAEIGFAVRRDEENLLFLYKRRAFLPLFTVFFFSSSDFCIHLLHLLLPLLYLLNKYELLIELNY